jgi:hypothetical protein
MTELAHALLQIPCSLQGSWRETTSEMGPQSQGSANGESARAAALRTPLSRRQAKAKKVDRPNETRALTIRASAPRAAVASRLRALRSNRLMGPGLAGFRYRSSLFPAFVTP